MKEEHDLRAHKSRDYLLATSRSRQTSSAHKRIRGRATRSPCDLGLRRFLTQKSRHALRPSRAKVVRAYERASISQKISNINPSAKIYLKG
ncbi:uncharacterized protein MYCFIDRAFT_212494 [Pseudocercospora fijiensis CIRAD86]|uniref:Uncharacterized protein n=1 Tax=Pseudocercospora fijiensis (strain CIRAD86) TaxID=383855 RepID=M3AP80_PSEFD|nr:uncharacterized protein MYCFIDRAFT_212494 [Pseudocercospora fijiensis CIRAD86]EME78928.1 hypothetical protein MYCFIDRAFT_212494 [Pseudocercospora fijiensis CIRAD86]